MTKKYFILLELHLFWTERMRECSFANYIKAFFLLSALLGKLSSQPKEVILIVIKLIAFLLGIKVDKS
jgi:hypothetical protein